MLKLNELIFHTLC